MRGVSLSLNAPLGKKITESVKSVWVFFPSFETGSFPYSASLPVFFIIIINFPTGAACPTRAQEHGIGRWVFLHDLDLRRDPGASVPASSLPRSRRGAQLDDSSSPSSPQRFRFSQISRQHRMASRNKNVRVWGLAPDRVTRRSAALLGDGKLSREAAVSRFGLVLPARFNL